MKRIAGAGIAFAALLPAAQLADEKPADIRVNVNLVTLACPVNDRGGLPVKNLKAADFRGQESRHYFKEG